ncbi:MAG: Rrf2 family transcriptional regulator [Candidatus Eisenbacteria bacterium]|nr:Rrf2 family transcriptional regulator [Candidatus Eisenbacteria bacterium]
MRFTTAAGRYGVRAMYDLAVCFGEGPIAGKDIARRQSISLPYLDQLMSRLRRGGLVKSVRGPQGGYLLARNPARIRVGDIVRAVEGPIQFSYCLEDASAARMCARADSCVSRILIKKLNASIVAALDRTSLRDLCKETKALSCPERRRSARPRGRRPKSGARRRVRK